MTSTAGRYSLLLDLESAMSSRDIQQRATVLQRVTDLFISAANDAEQIALFDDVFLQLAQQVEATARAKLACRLADVNTAPNRIIQSLAQDHVIDVAEPVLARSTQVSEESLILVAKTRSQAHLLSIAGRSPVQEPVSDVLVNRGDVDVLRRLSANLDARFSEEGFAGLATRGAKDGEIAENMANRCDVPPRIYRLLLAQATDAVRARLLKDASPEQYRIICEAMDEVCREFNQALKLEFSAEARRCVYEAYQNNRLNEDVLAEFARTKMFAETVISLAVLTLTPVETVEHQMVSGRMSGLLVLCKSNNYKWGTAKAVICAGHERSSSDIEKARHEYYALSVRSAARALRFVGARQVLMNRDSEDRARPIKPEMKVLLTGLDKRSGKDRRSGVDTDEEKRLIGERRSGVDRRSGMDGRSGTAAPVSPTTTAGRKP
jgi:uncharacterized protein (DUF2336 family)